MRYDYDCPKCGIIELSHSMTETVSECPNCKSKIEKVFSATFGILKPHRPVYAYNDVLKYKTCKHEQEPRRKVNKKADGHRGANRVW